jgi:SAM-dependent methyltransferase
MEGYTRSTYGDAFADVYDEWYADVSDVESMVALLADLAAIDPSLPVLELGAGTGRLAVPLATRVGRVVAIDSSPAMLAKLAANDTDLVVDSRLGDMVDDLPDGPFAVVFVAFNTFFNLLDADRQQACFGSVAERLAPDGVFVLDAFVPEPRSASTIEVRSITVDEVVLNIASHDVDAQTAHGQCVSISESGGVRLRPWAIRYATVEQLDAMAEGAGLSLAGRWEDARRTPFDADSSRHVSVYRRFHTPVPTAVEPST